MKNCLIGCFFVFSCLICFGQDKQAVLNAIEAQRTAWNNGDIDGFMQTYWKSDSLVFVGKTGPAYGWQKTIDHYKKAYPDKAAMGQLAFRIVQLNLIDGSNAFVLGAWDIKRAKDALGGYFTLWFRKINGEWKIICDHTS